MKMLAAASLCLLSASVAAHPINELYTIAKDLRENNSKVVTCTRHVDDNLPIDSVCNYIASRGAQVLDVLVRSLEADDIPVTRENRKKLKSIAWDNLSMWEMGYGAWVLGNDELERSSTWIGKNRPDMIRPYLSSETFNKLKSGGFLD